MSELAGYCFDKWTFWTFALLFTMAVQIRNKRPINPKEAAQLIMEFLEVEWDLDQVIVTVNATGEQVIGGNES